MNKLKKIRQNMRLRQIDLAKRAGVGLTTIYYIESGYEERASQKTKEKIALGLGKKVEEIFVES